MAGLIDDIRGLLEFHRRLGISFYPRGRGVTRLLADRNNAPTCPPAPASPAPAAPRTGPAVPPPVSRDATTAMAAVRQAVAGCGKCPRRRKDVAPLAATGAVPARLMVVVDGPSEEDLAEGILLAGEAGELFDRMLAAIGLDRDRICLTAMTRCAPVPWREPQPGECLACQPWLLREITVVRPRVILVMGPAAAGVVARGGRAPLPRLRGRLMKYAGLDTVVSHPPAALLADNSLKRESWDDLKMVQARLR